MAYDVTEFNLQSRIKRQLVGLSGVRRIEAPLETTGDNSGGGIIRQILSFGGWLIAGIKSLFRFSATGVWGQIVQTSQFLWHFNWNASDAELDQQMGYFQNLIGGMLGGTLGSAAGYYVCGILPASRMIRFNEALGARVLEEASDEAFDEMAANLSMLCYQAFQMATQATLIAAYKNTRRAIKTFFDNPDSPQSQVLQGVFGEKIYDAVDAWGENNKPWSFAQAVDEKVENIQNPFLQNFTEEFLEEFFDSCVEAGYIVANGIDSWYAEQRLQRDIVLGSQRGVEIKPNRESDERIILVGREEVLRPAITQVMAQSQFVENRDIGQFVGEPVREYLKAAPTKLTLKLVWSRYENPPMFREGVYKPPTLEIKGFRRSQLEFDLIKLLMGGENGRNWGRFWASASLLDDNGTIVARPKLFAGSEEEAEDLLTALLGLSEYEVGSMSTGEEKRVGRKATGRAMAKVTTRVYPAFLTIFHAEKILNEEEGRAQLSGSYKRRDDRLPLWVSTKPSNWEETINELLLATGASAPTP